MPQDGLRKGKMGNEQNAKLIRRKIRQELRPVYQAVGSMAQALHKHLQESMPSKSTQEEPAKKEDGGQENLPATAT